MHTVAVVSDGMASVTLAHHLADQGHELTLLSFDDGQRHSRELAYARKCADRLGADFELADLSSISHLLAGSSLTSADIEVPDGHYAEDNMKVTVVPNRNAIMIAVAVGLAVSIEAGAIAIGAPGGDHFIYPDCRPGFVDAMNTAMRLANDGFGDPDLRVHAPFITMSKADIATLGGRLGVPWSETWSCYKGGEWHCGSCGTCTERIEAFALAGLEDPTEYSTEAESPS